MLMAEGDRDLYRRQQAALAREKEIMKDVPGWEVGVYVSSEMLIDSGLLPGGQKCI